MNDDRYFITSPVLIRDAIAMMRLARDYLAEAGAKRAADKMRKALKSAEGAERHAQGKQWRNQ